MALWTMIQKYFGGVVFQNAVSGYHQKITSTLVQQRNNFRFTSSETKTQMPLHIF
jgi:hypothetical protein